MIMENSSESGSSRGLNSSEVFNRNPRLVSAAADHVSGAQFGYFREAGGAVIRPVEPKDVSLRQWLDEPQRAVDPLECLHIFTQVVEITGLAHSQGFVVHNIRPSCFVMSSFNCVSFIESASCSDSGSDSYEDVSNLRGSCSPVAPTDASNRARFESGSGDSEAGRVERAEEKNHPFPMKRILQMETDWYTSPEEAAGAPSSPASDVYRLGVLLFELYCTCSSPEEKNDTMSSLKHRVFPPQLLLKWPKEALFCLWLLHPEPSKRPKMDEVVQSEFLTQPRDNLDERKAAAELKEKIEEQDLLLEFLLMLRKRKQEAADNLRTTVSVLSSDLKDVKKLRSSMRRKSGSSPELGDDSASSGSRKRVRLESDGNRDEENQENAVSRNPRLMRNFRKLESAYFSTRRRALNPQRKNAPVSSGNGRGSAVVSSATSPPPVVGGGWVDSFLGGLCKYLTFNELKVKADLRQGDLLNSANLVCSLGFDRDGEFFATAGVSRKIKVFEYNSIVNENRDIHYPVVEMASQSKLSSICWNGYIKSHIASSNFEGVVQVWDVTRSQVFTEMREHERRVWSVDFSSADPTLLASGSDDGSVKLWNINQGVSVGTIQTKANVCCVQFPPGSGNSVVFGSADHRIYCYDLRNVSRPLRTLIGHEKTVSYVKFVDPTSLVSSSTDNTLKLWDLAGGTGTGTSHVLDSPVQSFTGHMNVKNFVGLSVSDGYIATGSETNEVFIYHKAFPMPTLSYKFNTVDPISQDEVDDAEQFISSVCWREQSTTLVAANSMGNIKLLEMV